MRVKTGEVATARLIVDIWYRCSSCGKDNLVTETIKGSAHTGTFMGVNLDQNLAGHAQDALKANLTTVLDQNNSQRFRTAGFTCHCKNCGHAEPWARMNYDRLEKPNAVSVSILIVSIIMSLVGLSSGPFNFMHYFFFGLLALSAAACLGISAYKNKNSEKMEQLIASLPRESLPVILPRSKERHDSFSRGSGNHTAAEVTYDKWVCKECGTQNSMQYAQCKKCGKFKSS